MEGIKTKTGLEFQKLKIITIKKDELPRLKCFHNGIILIVSPFTANIDNIFKINTF